MLLPRPSFDDLLTCARLLSCGDEPVLESEGRYHYARLSRTYHAGRSEVSPYVALAKLVRLLAADYGKPEEETTR
jgi:hypothetical protein